MNDDRVGRYLAYVLRHHPQDLDLSLDPQGFVDATLLVERMALKGFVVTMTDLERIVANDAKGRYALREGRIRANQGHSIPTSAVELVPRQPPPVLYHGTTVERWQKIQQSEGLQPMQRHHVHLSADAATGWQVGRRYRREHPILLQVDAAAMVADGRLFYLSENGVWLADTVPLRYIHPAAGPLETGK